jgi:hypothetical protein
MAKTITLRFKLTNIESTYTTVKMRGAAIHWGRGEKGSSALCSPIEARKNAHRVDADEITCEECIEIMDAKTASDEHYEIIEET